MLSFCKLLPNLGMATGGYTIPFTDDLTKCKTNGRFCLRFKGLAQVIFKPSLSKCKPSHMNRYQYDINVTGGNAAYRYNDGQTGTSYGRIMHVYAHKPYIYRVLIVYFLMKNQGRQGFIASRGRTQAKVLCITSLREIGPIRSAGGLIVYFFPYFALGWNGIHAGDLPSGAELPFLHGMYIPIPIFIYVHARTYIILYIYPNKNIYHYQNVFRNGGRNNKGEPITLTTSQIQGGTAIERMVISQGNKLSARERTFPRCERGHTESGKSREIEGNRGN